LLDLTRPLMWEREQAVTGVMEKWMRGYIV
jgi:hypothetical protein